MNLRVGLIGRGTISKFYLTALEKSDNLALAAICDRNEKKLESYRNRLACYTDYQDLLAQTNVDALIINVPNDQHFRICKDALLADKHVCCEKPLTIRLKDAEELVKLSHQTGKTLFTAFHRRYNINFQKALQGLPDLSAVDKVTASYLEKIEDHIGEDPWYLQPDRCGGGCIADNGPNVFDMLSYFLGRLQVVSVIIDLEKSGVEMQARLNLQSECGIPAQVHLDWTFPGEKKDVIINLKDGQQIYADMLKGFNAFKSSLFHEYEAILVDFASQVIAGRCHGEDGFDSVRLVHEAYKLANWTHVWNGDRGGQ